MVTFLAFHPIHSELAGRLGRAVTDHSTPVGTGTVARTKRIPVEKRAEAAVIAWMRHQTTGYDGMMIPRVKGKRREVWRMLARRSHELQDCYRRGGSVPEVCPIQKVLNKRPVLGSEKMTEGLFLAPVELPEDRKAVKSILGHGYEPWPRLTPKLEGYRICVEEDAFEQLRARYRSFRSRRISGLLLRFEEMSRSSF